MAEVNGSAIEVKKQTAVETRRAPLPFVPTNFEEAWRIAETLSKSGLLPQALQGKPQDVLVTILTGAEIGLSPMQSIRDIAVVKGKGYIGALLKVALVEQSPVCEKWEMVESTDKVATFETQRRGRKPTRLSFTIEDARRAELIGGDNWRKYPALMLRRRCESQLCDEVYPDVIRGIATREEMEEVHGGDLEPIERRTYAPPPPPPPEPKQESAPVESTPAEPEPVHGEPIADPVDALLSELGKATSDGAIDDLSVKTKSLNLGARRAEVAAAFSKRRKEVGNAARA
jgi:hypothetical protein